MALFHECMQWYAQNLLDTADIVREAMFQQKADRVARSRGWLATNPVLYCHDKSVRIEYRLRLHNPNRRPGQIYGGRDFESIFTWLTTHPYAPQHP